jgi:hypothetical protein
MLREARTMAVFLETIFGDALKRDKRRRVMRIKTDKRGIISEDVNSI